MSKRLAWRNNRDETALTRLFCSFYYSTYKQISTVTRKCQKSLTSGRMRKSKVWSESENYCRVILGRTRATRLECVHLKTAGINTQYGKVCQSTAESQNFIDGINIKLHTSNAEFICALICIGSVNGFHPKTVAFIDTLLPSPCTASSQAFSVNEFR